LNTRWQALETASTEKKQRLAEANDALLFNRECDEIDAWMDEVESQLSSEDHGKDITRVNALLKKHQLLEEAIGKHEDKVENIKARGIQFGRTTHFMAKELEERGLKIHNRYQELADPCQTRHDNLEDALLLYQFYRDVEDELSWIQEKRPTAASTDLGSNLSDVHILVKKHQALESEIVSHEPLIEAVANTAHHMVEKKHYASKEVQQRLDYLNSQLQQLKDLAAQRKARLQDALESQTFYTEVAEAKSWMDEKKPLLVSSDPGKDEDSVHVSGHLLDLPATILKLFLPSVSSQEVGCPRTGH
jgi:spectrin beta